MLESDELSDVIEWILRQGSDSDDLSAILAGVCERLVARGVPIWRSSIGLDTIDPAIASLSFVWRRDGKSSNRSFTPDDATGPAYHRSPIYYLLERREIRHRWKLDDPELLQQFPLFQELRAEGATEYALQVVPFSARRTALQGVALSIATDRPGGFTDAEMAAIIELLPALAIVTYRIGLLGAATAALGAYLGPQTGRRVLQGMIHRGNSETISAALLLADLRGFTALADRAEGAAVMTWLNEHFDAIGDPVAAHGGEILKFLGDGLLAVFPAAESGPDAACRQALAAAAEARARTAALNARRAAAGDPVLHVHQVLHFGDVIYGNIGTVRRLDFTVIGRAVNEASRMEALGKELGRDLLLSESFAKHCGEATTSLGRHALRGIAEEREVYVLAPRTKP